MTKRDQWVDVFADYNLDSFGRALDDVSFKFRILIYLLLRHLYHYTNWGETMKINVTRISINTDEPIQQYVFQKEDGTTFTIEAYDPSDQKTIERFWFEHFGDFTDFIAKRNYPVVTAFDSVWLSDQLSSFTQRRHIV